MLNYLGEYLMHAGKLQMNITIKHRSARRKIIRRPDTIPETYINTMASIGPYHKLITLNNVYVYSSSDRIK